jgi:hypothetical protein
MIFSRTTSPGRYYFSGVDWVMAALDRLNKNHSAIGNHSQLVLVLKGYLDKTALAALLEIKISQSLFYKGTIRRAWHHLAPYWVPQPQAFDRKDIQFFDLVSKSCDKLDATIQACAKIPFKDEKTFLAFVLIHCNDHSYLMMRFDHKLFDARGAEALLGHILDESDPAGSYDFPSQSPQLDLWKTRFASGQHINRFLRSIYSPETRVACLAQTAGPDITHHFFHTSFSREQTETIEKNAMKNAGYLMNGIFFLSCAAKGFDGLCKKEKGSQDLLIPINVDMRETKFASEKFFFNHLSFMFFKVRTGLKISEYIQLLKKQFIDQTRNKTLFHFMNASLLMRIVPLGTLSNFMNKWFKKNPCSFSFSYVGNQGFNIERVKGHSIVNLFHIPIVPVKPGVGIFFTRFNNKLNMIIASFDNTLCEKDGQYLQEKIISELNCEKI